MPEDELYDEIAEYAQQLYFNYNTNSDEYIPFDDCVREAVDFYWEQVISDENYYGADYDELYSTMISSIISETNEEDLLDEIQNDDEYRGMSDQERNYNLFEM